MTYLPQTNPTFTFTVAIEGQGTVTPTTGDYQTGSQLVLAALATEGWKFDHWEGDMSGSTNPASLLLNADKSVKAIFVQTADPNTVTDPKKDDVQNMPPLTDDDLEEAAAQGGCGCSPVTMIVLTLMVAGGILLTESRLRN